MSTGNPWEGKQADPTAGVTLFHVVKCPRCGFVKGSAKTARPGLCRDCSAGMTSAERRAWGEPRKTSRTAAA